MNNINNGCPDVNFKSEADFDRRKSLKEDFLFYDVTVEGTTQDMFVKYLTLFQFNKSIQKKKYKQLFFQ